MSSDSEDSGSDTSKKRKREEKKKKKKRSKDVSDDEQDSDTDHKRKRRKKDKEKKKKKHSKKKSKRSDSDSDEEQDGGESAKEKEQEVKTKDVKPENADEPRVKKEDMVKEEPKPTVKKEEHKAKKQTDDHSDKDDDKPPVKKEPVVKQEVLDKDGDTTMKDKQKPTTTTTTSQQRTPVLPFDVVIRRPPPPPLPPTPLPSSSSQTSGRTSPARATGLDTVPTPPSPPREETVMYDATWENSMSVQEKEEAAALVIDHQFLSSDVKMRCKHPIHGYTPFPMAVALTNHRTHKALLSSDDCFVSWKPDGVRYYLILNPKVRPEWVLVPRTSKKTFRLREPAHDAAIAKAITGKWIVDVELIKGGCLNGADLLLAHDVLMGNDRNLESMKFEDRYKYLQWLGKVLPVTANAKRACFVVKKFVKTKHVSEITSCLQDVYPEEKERKGKTAKQLLAECKTYYVPTKEQDSDFAAACGTERRILCDGLFFQKASAQFNSRHESQVCQLKWKALHTNDFETHLQQRDYVLYHDVPGDHNGRRRSIKEGVIQAEDVSPGMNLEIAQGIASRKSDEPYIMECYYDSEISSYRFLRPRLDKVKANIVPVVTSSLKSTNDNIQLADVIRTCMSGG